jgi:hypothetical protein
MPKDIVELRILPPFAIARLGSSAEPMDNYDFEYPDPVGYRRIVAAPTLHVDPKEGTVSLENPPFAVSFRDAKGLIRPVCPFLEVWARCAGEADLVPLTRQLLTEAGLTPADVKWQVQVGNIKAYRRTGNPNDRIEAHTEEFSDHAPQTLAGTCPNFVANASIPFGSVRYLAPGDEFPEIRLRFTPATGKVYGPTGTDPDPNVDAVVYDAAKGKWPGYFDASGTGLDARKVTIPGAVYAGYADKDGNWVSRGYLDDECDGTVSVKLGKLTAYARIAAGPPSFAPDSMPVRTVGDEIEQALGGPTLDSPATDEDLDEVRDVVRRALETVRLMNTTQMNAYSKQPGVGMARMDTADVNRAPEPIFDPTLADSLAVQARHERVLLALESETLAWFASVLRDYDRAGDLSDSGRHKMPAMMRGADSRYLALTRRQVNRIRATADMVLKSIRAGGA